jgi:coenzyme F420-0:L-glutamate ligase/coenzyme F420-1:gamma-L-glutamate ligase
MSRNGSLNKLVPLVITPILGIPLIQPGDSLGQIIWQGLNATPIELQDGDIIVIAQKIVSKAENRLARLSSITPSSRANEIAAVAEKDPRFVELVLQESREVLRVRAGTLIVEHKLGFICANAGIDHSNILGDSGDPMDWVLLLPENPGTSAQKIRKTLEHFSGKRLGVLIIDSHGRAWRLGTVGVAIGFSGIPGLVDFRGKPDLFGYKLRVTQVAAADELAAAASLIMGQADEGIPVVHVRGFPFSLREGDLPELIRPRDLDLFR